MRAVSAGDLDGLLAVLDPDASLRIDAAARFDGVVPIDAPAQEAGQAREITGASAWAARMIGLSKGLPVAQGIAQAALIDGSVGIIFAPRARLVRALIFTCADDRITRVEAIGDPVRLGALRITVL